MSENEGIGTEDDDDIKEAIKRYTYQPPTDSKSAAGKEMEVITSYMKDTHLQDMMSNLLCMLLSLTKLPYNPYPGFVSRLRPIAEGVGMKDTRLQDMMSNLLRMLLSLTKLPYNPYPGFVSRLRPVAEGFQVFDMTSVSSSGDKKIMKTSVSGMYGLQGCDNVWGLKHMVHVMNGKGLKGYDWLIQDVTPKRIVGIEEHSGYSGQILVALVGPAAFTESLYGHVDTVDVRLEYVIYGLDVNVGLDLFVSSIVEDIEVITRDTCPHQLLGVSVPLVSADTSPCEKQSSSVLVSTSSRPKTNAGKSKTATVRASHTTLLKTAIRSSTSSLARAFTSGDSTNSKGTPSVPEVWTIEDIHNRQDEFVSAIHRATNARQPITMQCVYTMNKEKQYFKRGSKQYVLHFIETREDSDEESLFSFAKLPFITVHEGVFLKKADCETYMMTMNRHSHIAREIEAAKTSQASVLRAQQMFAGSDDAECEEKVPYLDIVVAPIKLHFEQTISTLDPVMDAFKVAHLILNQILLERTRWHNDILVEIQRFFHSTAHRWHVAMCHNTLIQQVIQCQVQGVMSHQHQDMLTQAVRQYRGVLIHVLDTAFVVEERYRIKSAVKRNHQNIPSEVKTCQSKADMKNRKSKTPLSHQASSSPVKEVPQVVPHGVEDKRITQQRNIFVDVETAKQESRWPRIIVDDAVLIQYLVDVKLDQVWREFLLDLFSKPWLPPNPYLCLIAHLRQAALRMQLCQETNQQLASHLLHFQSVKTVDETNAVCTIPGYNVYGGNAALVGLDTNTSGFLKIAAVTKGVTRRLMMTRKGQFQIFHGTAVGGLCPLYGQLVPYLTQLVVHEYYYIKGPMGVHSEAIQLFAKVAYEQVTEIMEPNLVILGVYFGESDLFPIQQILDNKEQFMSHLIHAVNDKHDISIKLYQAIGWRYLCIVKYLSFHYLYVDNAQDRCEPFYPYSSLQFYRSVFLDQKEASFHFEQVKCIDGISPCNSSGLSQVTDELDEQIRDFMKDSHDMMEVYKLLLTRALINKDVDSIAELWRVFHSVAFQMDYVNSLNQALQDLIQLTLENPGHMVSLKHQDQNRHSTSTKVHLLNEDTLVQFYQAYRDKFKDVIRDPCAFAPVSLIRLVETKLGDISDANSLSVPGTLLDKKTLGILQDIAELILPIKDITAADMLNICPRTQQILQEVLIYHEG
ncbi:uncharacterized protein [Amphiura filiformis]|uniref:uncharacterized protein n=1 Tax=Amphiura filiformis TaxID=82378 RepID=UPI003B214224